MQLTGTSSLTKGITTYVRIQKHPEQPSPSRRQLPPACTSLALCPATERRPSNCSHYELGDAVARAALCTKQNTFVHLLVPSSCRRNRFTDHWPETLVPQIVPLTNELRSKFPVDAWLLEYDQNLHGIRIARSREHLILSVRC